jgi:hypothetical protein
MVSSQPLQHRVRLDKSQSKIERVAPYAKVAASISTSINAAATDPERLEPYANNESVNRPASLDGSLRAARRFGTHAFRPVHRIQNDFLFSMLPSLRNTDGR